MTQSFRLLVSGFKYFVTLETRNQKLETARNYTASTIDCYAQVNISPCRKSPCALKTSPERSQESVSFASTGRWLLRFSRTAKPLSTLPAIIRGQPWLQPLDGSKGRQITDFTAEHIYDFHWSFDGKQLALVRGHTDSDVVLIRENH